MSEILHLNLHREFFTAIANKQKRIEYRRQSRYWRKRLEERKYDAILFRNGYAKDAPEMLVEFRGLRRYGKGHTAYYAISLQRILKIKRWAPAARSGMVSRSHAMIDCSGIGSNYPSRERPLPK